MSRVVFLILRLYLLAAIATRVAEASGLWRQCGCSPDCWCKRPGLSLFRWVVPVGHRSVDSEGEIDLRDQAEVDGESAAVRVAAPHS
jgi:hypothetical protein